MATAGSANRQAVFLFLFWVVLSATRQSESLEGFVPQEGDFSDRIWWLPMLSLAYRCLASLATLFVGVFHTSDRSSTDHLQIIYISSSAHLQII